MAEIEIYDHVAVAVADYDYTFNIKSHQILPEEGLKQQEILEGDDGSETVITHSNTSIFYVTLIWAYLSASDAGIIFDLFHNTTKANQYARSFRWYSYADLHTYVVKFRSPLVRNRVPGTHHTVNSIKLKIIGKITDA